jgi:hypothetical protein
MPLGKNNTGDFRNGTAITLPHNFGNVITTIPANNHNPIPTSGTEKNAVNWATPDPTHFGNTIP